MPVGSFPRGISPFGLTHAAGQVFESTSTAAGLNRYIVKGGSWDDNGCGLGRPVARHSLQETLKHIIRFSCPRMIRSHLKQKIHAESIEHEY